MKKVLFFGLAMLAMAAVQAYKISGDIRIGGEGRWDDLYVDAASHRLYVAHNTRSRSSTRLMTSLSARFPLLPAFTASLLQVIWAKASSAAALRGT